MCALKNILIFLVFLFCGSPSFGKEIPLSMWVECEGSNKTLSSIDKIERMVEFSHSLGVKDLFVQVYRGNRVWFNSSLIEKGLVDNYPYNTFKEKEGEDPLLYVIKEAHSRGIKVHAWVNTFRIAKNLKAPLLKTFGKEIVIVDSKGRSMLDYPNLNIPGEEGKYFSTGSDGYWLNPGDSRVGDFLKDLIIDLVKKYPGIDGIHLDFVRYPYCVPYSPGSRWMKGVDFGYNRANRLKFMEKYGLDPLNMEKDRLNCQNWDDFRRNTISDFVKDIFKMSGDKGNSRIEFSSAVLCWPDRAYFSAFQDWRRWMEEGVLDFIISMNYGTDDRLVTYLSREAVSSGHSNKVYIGIGAYLLKKDPEKLYKQITDSVAAKADGITIFSYDAVKDIDSFKKTILKLRKERILR